MHYINSFDVECEVVRNDDLKLESLKDYDRIILSPGPGLPSETKNLLEIFQFASPKTPILGVCLGMQAVAVYFGGSLINQKEVKHGVQAEVNIIHSGILFKDLPLKIKVGLYHSWMVDENNFPDCLQITSFSSEGVPMSLEHRFRPIVAVQFHPESILSEHGGKIISNFLFASW